MAGPDPKPTSTPRRRPRRRTVLEEAASRDWHRRTVAFGCRVCRSRGEQCEGVVQGHHVLRAQLVRDHVRTVASRDHLTPSQRNDLEIMLLWDIRNGLGVCYRAHRRHHSRVEPIPMSVVPASAIEFATELDLLHRIENEYS